MGFEKALDYCQQLGLDAIELPVGAYPGKPFFDPDEVLKSKQLQQEIKDAVAARGLIVSAPRRPRQPGPPGQEDRQAARARP